MRFDLTSNLIIITHKVIATVVAMKDALGDKEGSLSTLLLGLEALQVSGNIHTPP